MVRLNENHLQSQQIDRLFEQLSQLLSPQQSKSTSQALTELLGAEERIMLSKRLAIIVLLTEGFSNYKIANELKLSKSTVTTVAAKLERGHYQSIQQLLNKDPKQYFAVLETIDNILHLGGILPHYNGIDRYNKTK